MSAVSLLKNLYLCYFSQPVADRAIYRALRPQVPRSIVEIGVGKAVRTRRLIQRVLQNVPAAEIRYTGIDLFEARPTPDSGLSLKDAHRLLKPLGVRAQLVPGDPCGALARVANSLRATDLLLISHDQDGESLARAWYFLPRMLHETSRVFLETAEASGAMAFEMLTREEIERRAQQQQRLMRRAA